MEYLSCFSGIGGLEGTNPPIAFCEIDSECQKILIKRFPNSKIYDDINILHGSNCDVVTGGWPCQDISIAGKQKGLSGENSGLFYSLVRVAVESSAHTIIAENVPNLLKLEQGEVFKEVLREFSLNGYKYISWRTLNAREFGLPHNRNRVFMIASKLRNNCMSVFRPLPDLVQNVKSKIVAGFYWTAGTQSICYSIGYVPTIKVGSSLSIPSPPAIHFGNTVRQLSPSEALSLQGFDSTLFEGIKKSTIYRMAGNAVARPLGRFVVDGVLNEIRHNEKNILPKQLEMFNGFNSVDSSRESNKIPLNGYFEKGILQQVKVKKPQKLASNLDDFIDLEDFQPLSIRAATGLLRRLERSGQSCPVELKIQLETIGKVNA
jgi:DNA (cytosine-5)-methyltransferase 1